MLPVLKQVDVCIYHSPCTDGFGAAYACWTKFGNEVEYLPGIYAHNQEDEAYWLEKVRDKHVVVGDFSFPRELTEKLHAAAASFVVLDHHAPMAAELADLDYCYYDSEMSGATMMWQACHYSEGNNAIRREPIPRLLRYVQTQDLWHWSEPHAHTVCAYLNSIPFDFTAWEGLRQAMESDSELTRIIDLGDAMLRKQDAIAEAIVEQAESWSFCGHEIVAANCPSILRSFVCDKLGQLGDYPFVAAYHINDGKVTWSLRSNHGTEDVAAIARNFEIGGGHVKAAGVTVPVNDVDFVNRKVG